MRHMRAQHQEAMSSLMMTHRSYTSVDRGVWGFDQDEQEQGRAGQGVWSFGRTDQVAVKEERGRQCVLGQEPPPKGPEAVKRRDGCRLAAATTSRCCPEAHHVDERKGEDEDVGVLVVGVVG